MNPIVRRALRWYANWNPEGDVTTAIGDVFEESETVETYFAGAAYTVVAHKGR